MADSDDSDDSDTSLDILQDGGPFLFIKGILSKNRLLQACQVAYLKKLVDFSGILTCEKFSQLGTRTVQQQH